MSAQPRGFRHDQVQVAGVKAERDAAVGLVRAGEPALHGPLAAQRPLIEAQPLGDGVAPAGTRHGPAG